MTKLDSYKHVFPHAKLTRSAEGILEVVLHTDGDTLVFDGHAHEEFVDLFHQIGQDVDNRAVILTGAGKAFIDRIDPAGFDFFTPTGFGTVVAEGKEIREFDGRPYVMERALAADFAFVKAWKGDKWGNLVYRKTARNFNPMMATAAKVTIAEVEHLVEVGELDPEAVHTPSVFVTRIFQGELFEKRIERRTVRPVT